MENTTKNHLWAFKVSFGKRFVKLTEGLEDF